MTTWKGTHPSKEKTKSTATEHAFGNDQGGLKSQYHQNSRSSHQMCVRSV